MELREGKRLNMEQVEDWEKIPTAAWRQWLVLNRTISGNLVETEKCSRTMESAWQIPIRFTTKCNSRVLKVGIESLFFKPGKNTGEQQSQRLIMHKVGNWKKCDSESFQTKELGESKPLWGTDSREIVGQIYSLITDRRIFPNVFVINW